jgi:hypothetical protein
MFPATTSNEITKSYYMCLKGQINRGTCSKEVLEVRKTNGSHSYSTYHLISEM